MIERDAVNPDIEYAHSVLDALNAEVARHVVMDRQPREVAVGAACLEGAVILEGVPGTGKTLLARTLAGALGGKFSRVQGTPDILPGDITGYEIFDPRTTEFKWIEGPIFSNVNLVDEFNRLLPKSQSAYLEGMEERQVTTRGVTRELPRPFIVFATQNPHEIGAGTNPLTVANLDRFWVSVTMPTLSDEEKVMVANMSHEPKKAINGPEVIPEVRAIIEEDTVATPDVMLRAARIISALNRLDHVDSRESVLGGNRLLKHMLGIARALAVTEKTHLVRDSHVDVAADYVLAHRTQLTETAADRDVPIQELIDTAKQHASR